MWHLNSLVPWFRPKVWIFCLTVAQNVNMHFQKHISVEVCSLEILVFLSSYCSLSLPFLLSSFLSFPLSPLQSASGYVSKSCMPGKWWMYSLFWATSKPPPLLSSVGPFLWSLFLLLSSYQHWKKTFWKSPFSKCDSYIGGWSLCYSQCFTWDQSRNICLISILVHKPNARHRTISFTCLHAPHGWDLQPVWHCCGP